MTKDSRLNVVGDVPDGYDGLLFIKRVRDRGQTVNVVLTETEAAKGMECKLQGLSRMNSRRYPYWYSRRT